MSPTDPELVRLCARGDREALGALYDRHAGGLLAVARKMLSSDREAEDLVHDVFVETWRRAGDYDPERASVRTWLVLRTRSRCLDLLKAPARLRRSEWPAEEPRGEPPDSSRIADAARVRGEIARLPDDHREVLLLAYFEDLSMSEIAARLGLPIGTVKSRCARALGRLKEVLQP